MHIEGEKRSPGITRAAASLSGDQAADTLAQRSRELTVCDTSRHPQIVIIL